MFFLASVPPLIFLETNPPQKQSDIVRLVAVCVKLYGSLRATCSRCFSEGCWRSVPSQYLCYQVNDAGWAKVQNKCAAFIKAFSSTQTFFTDSINLCVSIDFLSLSFSGEHRTARPLSTWILKSPLLYVWHTMTSTWICAAWKRTHATGSRNSESII